MLWLPEFGLVVGGGVRGQRAGFFPAIFGFSGQNEIKLLSGMLYKHIKLRQI